MAKKRIIEENGVIVEKYIKEATTQFEKNGKIFPAQPQKNMLACVSGSKYDAVKGYQSCIMLEYVCGIDTYEKAKYGAKVKVRYEMTNYGYKPVEVVLQ